MTGLVVDELTVTYPGPPAVRAVDGISLTVAPGECVGVLGESGSGKSTLAWALLGLAAPAVVEGRLALGELDLGALDEDAWRAVRWRRIALSFQSTGALNPVLRVGAQVAEPLEAHLAMDHRQAAGRAADLLDEVGLGAEHAGRYPNQLSGGQRRLALLAMALACDPEVLVLDEPTVGLDPVTRSRVLDVLGRIRREAKVAMLVLGHDADALEMLADRVLVVYRGWLAETGPAPAVLGRPRNPYSWALLNARPTLASVKDLRGIKGEPPDPTEVALGCPFLGRCTQPVAACAGGRPPLVAPAGEDGGRLVACIRGGLVRVLEARGVRKSWRLRTGLAHSDEVAAVDGVDLEVGEGEVVGLVGSTGAGKTTLAQLLVRLLEPDAGIIRFEGADLLAMRGAELKAVRRRAQLLFQDPYEALSTRMTVGQIVGEPLDVQGLGTVTERQARVAATLADVRLPSGAAFLGRHTHELSGGQLQRVAMARALVLEPKLLVADEPASMLDPSEQAKLFQLLKHLQVERGMAMVVVSHDLAVVLRIADRVVVLDRGRVVEEGTGTNLWLAPRHPVTRALLAAAGRNPAMGTSMASADGAAQPEAVAASLDR